MRAMRHVLVAVDFSDPSRRAMELARDLAANLGAKITLAHVHEPAVDISKGMIGRAVGGPSSELKDDPDARRAAKKDLDALAAEVFGPGNAPPAVVAVGRAHKELLRIGGEIGADVICVGTTGRTGMQRALLGSVAERLVRSSAVPVLSVH